MLASARYVGVLRYFSDIIISLKIDYKTSEMRFAPVPAPRFFVLMLGVPAAGDGSTPGEQRL